MPEKRPVPDTAEDISDRDFRAFEDILLNEDPDEFQENRIDTRKPSDDPSPFTAQSSFTVRDIAGARHEARSEQAQSTDEALNAPIAPDYETWRENPDQYDLPGIDTISRDRLRERGREAVQRALDSGAVDSVGTSDFDGGTKGRFNRKFTREDGENVMKRTINRKPNLDDEEDFASFAEGPVLAHEAGHAFDNEAADSSADADFASESGLFDDEQLDEEATRLSKRARGEFAESQLDYRESDTERFADAFALAEVEPQAAKREAPNLFEKIQNDFM
jgi:hypothetical protein